ncbi:MAG: hypothetical protein B0D92_07965 [Spirochaeta sp. LUC14_002_19_P3]|nr:MAG: hypothetical protein B0D92_07965 [Spirochaeta sp. LUC14_002_19_P3]
MKKHVVLTVFLALLISSVAGGLTIKLGSPFPEGSAWDTSLKRMADRWREISGGQISVRIYPGGIVGDEDDMLRKMGFNQLDSAVLTIFGMKSLVSDTFVMALPGILQSEAELDYAINEFAPRFSENFISKGVRVLSWSKSGWAYFYTADKVQSPNELRREKLSVSNTDSELAGNFKTLGFNVVPLALNEVMTALQSGMVTAVYCPPIAAAAYQWFAKAPYMLDFKLSPVIGGIVISERTWQRIPAKFHADLLQAVDEVSREFYEEAENLNDKAMDVMRKNSLVVTDLSEREGKEWGKVFTDGHALLIGPDKWIANKVYKDFTAALEKMRQQ